MTTSDTPAGGQNPDPQEWRCKAIVQEGRAAATRGLLHDFSNVMVGLCSISENAVDDLPEDNPLHDDLSIIRDSAMRAHQLIRRIVQLNSMEPAEPDLIECRSWLTAELESLRAVLPKGSEVAVDQQCPVLFLRSREDALRDSLLVLALAAARRHRSRVNLVLCVGTVDGGVELSITDRPADNNPRDDRDVVTVDLPADYVDCCARKLGGRGRVEAVDNDCRRACILLPSMG